MMVDKYKGNHTLVKTIVFFMKKLLSGKRKKSERLQTAQQFCQKTKEYIHSKVFIYLSEVFITKSVDDVDTLNNFKAVTDSNELFFLVCTYLVWHIIYEKALEENT